MAHSPVTSHILVVIMDGRIASQLAGAADSTLATHSDSASRKDMYVSQQDCPAFLDLSVLVYQRPAEEGSVLRYPKDRLRDVYREHLERMMERRDPRMASQAVHAFQID